MTERQASTLRDDRAGAGDGRALGARSSCGLPLRWIYPALGAALSVGAPAGYLLLRCLLARQLPTPAWIALELSAQRVIYGYLTVSTGSVFVLLGRLLGAKEDVLRQSSITDSLTELANRRYFLARLTHEVARADRYGLPLAVLLVDVDLLKVINDVGGHAAGDEALRAVGDCLRRSCRAADLPARYGGDEFAVLLTSTHPDEALEVASRVRSALRSAQGPSVSIGVSGRGPHDRTDASALLAAADRALYQAKAEGRDRARAAPAPPQLARLIHMARRPA